MLSILLASVFICRGEEDLRIWKPCPSVSFSVGSFFGFFSIVLGIVLKCWGGLPLVGYCRKISTVDNIRKGMIISEAISNTCVLCSKEEDSITPLVLAFGNLF